MRIAQISTPHIAAPPKGFGASELIAGLLAEELTRRGHHVTLFTTVDSPARVSEVAYFPEARGLEPFELRELLHIGRALEGAREFDIIHNHCLSAGPAFGKLAPVPFISTLHYLSPAVRAFPRCTYVAVSESQRRSLPDLNIAAVVHNAIDPSAYTLRLEKKSYLLFLGRFHPNKGVHLAIEVAKRRGEHLIIAALPPPDDQRDYFDSHIRPHLGGLIEWVGGVEGPVKDELLGHARCVLLPICWDEPFGLVYLEAMACGTPVLTFARGAAPEVVQHGRTGYVVRTLDEMIAALDRIQDIDPWECRRHVEAHFTVSRMADDYLSVYQTLIEDLRLR